MQVPEAASYYSLEASTIIWKFPEPGYLEGVKTKDKAILKMTQMDFAYPGIDKNILTDVNVQARTLSPSPAAAGKLSRCSVSLHDCWATLRVCAVASVVF